MNVNVDVENALMISEWINQPHPHHKLQQLQNSQDNVIHVAKSRCFSLLRVMQTASPVDCDIAVAVVEPLSSTQGSSRGQGTIFKEAVKHRAIFTDIDLK